LTGEVSARARTVRQGSEALNRRDYEAIRELMDPDFEFVSAISAALLGERARTNAYRGIEGLRQFMQEIEESFADFRFETEGVREAGDRLVEFVRLSARGRGSGVPVELEVTRVFEFRGEVVRRVSVYLDRDEALRAAGLEND
jgi:ketosteroid isomerase-like protein